MKKILSLLASAGLVGTNASIVVACSPSENTSTKIVIQTDPLWDPLYERVAEKLNKENEENGLDFRYELKTASTGDEHTQIANKGVKDKSISDIFLMTFDQYQNYVVQNNIMDLSSLINSELLGTGTERAANEQMYGIKMDDSNKIEPFENQFAWNSVTTVKNGEQFIGMIPSNIENNIWVYDRSQLGLDETETQLVGAKLLSAQAIDKTITNDPTVANLIKINNALGENQAMIKVPLGWSGITITQGMFHDEPEWEAWFKENSYDGVPTLVWQKKGTEQGSTDVTDYDSVFENEAFDEIYKLSLKAIMEFGLSMSEDMQNSVIGKSNDDQFRIQHSTEFKDGKISMSLTETGLVKEEGAMLKTVAKEKGYENWTDDNISVSAASKIKLGNILEGTEDEKAFEKYADKALSPISAGSGWAIKSTIDDVSSTDNEGNIVTKQEAAVKFIKELTQPENAPDLARTAIGLTSYSSNAESAVVDLRGTGEIGDRVLADSIEAVTEAYANGDPTQRPNTALFDLIWGAYGDTFRLGLAAESGNQLNEFVKQFDWRWEHDKDLYIFG